MSAHRGEGPGLLTWLAGRLQFPPPREPCSRCGAPGADSDVARQLRGENLPGVAELATLCDACRKEARNRLLREEARKG